MLALAILACHKFDGDPLTEVDSADGGLHLEVRSDPQPPVLGATEFQYLVTDGDGAPVEGLQIEVVPYMPVMGMGTSVVPTVDEKGQGEYRVDNVDLVMEGRWELQTTFSGPVDDTADPSFSVSASP